VNEHNEKFEKGEISFGLKVNSRATLSIETKRATMNGLLVDEETTARSVSARADFELSKSVVTPASLDYRKHLADIMDQGKEV
jgi:hypothetical protein